MQVFQPSNQIKLTNVSVVRFRKGGKRFEIACYKNKVREYRTGVETDLSEVLQIESVFLNVSKGQIAPSSLLSKCFNTTDQAAIIAEILTKGELQVGEKERQHELGDMRREIANTVAERCVDPKTGRPHTVGMIEKAMDQVGFSVQPGKSAKSQALEVIKTLAAAPQIISLARAQMRIRLTLPDKDGKRLKSNILPLIAKAEHDEMDADGWELIAVIDPGSFKLINEMIQKECQGRGKLETMSFAAQVVEGEERIE